MIDLIWYRTYPWLSIIVHHYPWVPISIHQYTSVSIIHTIIPSLLWYQVSIIIYWNPLFIYIYTYIYIYVYIYIHVYIHVYIHICMYIYIHVYTYIYIYVCRSKFSIVYILWMMDDNSDAIVQILHRRRYVLLPICSCMVYVPSFGWFVDQSWEIFNTLISSGVCSMYDKYDILIFLVLH